MFIALSGSRKLGNNVPRFFIHTNDGDFYHRDSEGHELPDAAAAREIAIDALPDMARDKLPDGDHRLFKTEVADESGETIYEATLELSGSWKGATKP